MMSLNEALNTRSVDRHSAKRRNPISRKVLLTLKRWGVTIAAHVSSTYVLDSVAVVSGIALVGVVNMVEPMFLKNLSIGYAVAFLMTTYTIWGIALKKNLKANWRLLEETGTSTNAFSKAGYDLARSFTNYKVVQKVTAGTGYVVTELAKEIPYYVGAFSVTAISQGVSTTESFIFLGGANLGAAVYEYGLAKGTLKIINILKKRQRRGYASFDTEWIPAMYLRDYYSTIEGDERSTLRFFVDRMKYLSACDEVLFFGCGPALHHVFLAAPKAHEIHLADYLPSNLEEIRRWKDREAGAHDWNSFVKYTLQCEGIGTPTKDNIDEREEMVRRKITKLIPHADAKETNPLGKGSRGRYQVVFSPYCVDSITDKKEVWKKYMTHLSSLVAPGGHLLLAALSECGGYTVGDKHFPCANINKRDVEDVLRSDLNYRNMVIIEESHVFEKDRHGYSGIILVDAIKNI